MKLGELYEDHNSDKWNDIPLFVEVEGEVAGTKKLVPVSRSYSQTEKGVTRVVLVPAKPRASRAGRKIERQADGSAKLVLEGEVIQVTEEEVLREIERRTPGSTRLSKVVPGTEPVYKLEGSGPKPELWPEQVSKEVTSGSANQSEIGSD